MNIEFGKYRNQSYETIWNIEPSYILWLLKQPWFKVRHKPHYDYCERVSKIKHTPNKHLLVYTDGSCSNNGKKNSKGGLGIHFSEKNKHYFPDVSESIQRQDITNNIAELMAIQKALEITRGIKDVKIYTDSKYSLNVITKWYGIWLKKGLCKNKKNLDLIGTIYDMYNQSDAELIHVRAHTGNTDEHSIGNMIADRLATDSLQESR